MHPYNNRQLRYTAALLSALIMATGSARGQQAPSAAPSKETPTSNVTPATTEASGQDLDTIELTPFEVTATDSSKSYTASSTLAGNRLNTEVRDLGTSVSIISSQFLKDIGATDNQTLLQYTLGSEVGNYYGNFAGVGDGAALDESSKFTNPNQNTRVRGLAAADNTRDFFLSNTPWDGYNVDGVDLQRGPNSILFGQGSPAGIINVRTKQASFKDANEVSVRIGSWGSTRETIDLNKVIAKGQFAVRLAAVNADEKYKQKPAFDDTKRVFLATRIEPSVLKVNGMRTIIKANYENGSTSSNRPRSLPPIDLITPWFSKLGKATYIPAQIQDDNTGLPGHGAARPSINGGPDAGKPNPYYQPWLGNYGSQFGGALDFFNWNSPTMTGNVVDEPTMTYGIGPNGAVDKGVGGMPYQRPAGIATVAQYAKNVGLPFGKFGLYKDLQLTDPTIFDFYNKLLDGPNKKEWQKFNSGNLTISQTFFNDKIGIEYAHNAEHYRGGQLSLLSGERQAIYIDINSVYADGTPTGKDGVPFADGTANPNVGRAFITDNGAFGNNEQILDNQTDRLTVFANYDFAREFRDNVVLKALGQQTLTGLFAKDQQKQNNRNWQRYGTTDDYAKFVFGSDYTSRGIGDNALVPNTFIYLGDSLSARSSASGANLPNPTTLQVVKSGTVRTFDSHWNKPTDPSAVGYVDPNAAWFNSYYPVGNTSGNSTQSENPANYVGWRDVTYPLIDSETSAANRDYLTTSRYRSRAQEISKAVVWQGKMLNNSIVGTYGIRNDNVSGWQHTWTRNNTRNPDDVSWYNTVTRKSEGLTPTDSQAAKNNETSKSWSIVGHLNNLPGIKSIGDKLPFQLSVSYSRSTNFQPAALRTDLYGQPLPLPSGKTNDFGVLIESNDGKYSLKINKFTSDARNASSSALGGAWFIGASQAWSGNWVNRFEFDWSSDTESGKIVNPPDWQLSEWNYGQAPGETAEQAAAREQAAISAYRAWQASVDPRFYAAWGINLNDHTKSITANAPGGFTVTEDTSAKGYEIELNAMPIKNWRTTLNISKIEATRKNIGGALITNFVNAYQKALNETKAGDVRIWWGGAGNETSLYQWYNNIGGEWASRKVQEGTAVPESRLWHANLVTSYDFDSGRLKGFTVGGGVRYSSDITLGYSPFLIDNGNGINYDLTKPYKGPSETDFDLWLGYGRKLNTKIDWYIQLNIRNLFVKNELIPITFQPDTAATGSQAAGFRIRPPMVLQLTNTFKF